ncbi:MAG: glycosyltransferase family 9 protein [Opitutaceae bacterium]|nr:glycosyltransferase family 9 protein [Opitutaceae bacterium]
MIQTTEPREILYLHMAALGDAVMASPAMTVLKAACPEARITVLARAQAQAYFATLPQVDRVIPFVGERHVDRRRPWRLLGAPSELQRVVKEVRSTRWHACLQWRSQLPDTLLSGLSRASHRIVGIQRIHRPATLGAEQLGMFFTERVPLTGENAHLVEAFALPVLALLRKWEVMPPSELPGLTYPIGLEERRAAQEFLLINGVRSHERLAMINISAKSEFNRWTDDKFSALGDGLAEMGMRVVLSGVPEHREREIVIASRMKSPPVLSTGRLSMGAVAAVLERCRVLVALNTGIAHVSAALQVPVVVLNGRDGASITPWKVPHRVVTRNSHYPKRHPDPKVWPSLVPLIEPQEVIAAVQELVGSPTG